MGWFRSKTRLGACLALFALALSLMLSFGHLHWGEAAHPGDEAHLALSHAASDHGDADHDHDHHNRPHPCFICTVAMAAPFAATAPDLPAHDSATFRLLTPVAAFDLHDPLRTAFRSRAPPHA